MQLWETLDRVETREGVLELRRRGDEFVIAIAGRVLMNSAARRSEEALATLGCRGLADAPAPRVLVGGLGMALTVRAALDALPSTAVVEVAELHETVASWCRGPLAGVSVAALEDPRVRVRIEDVRVVVAAAARAGSAYDAILLDLYEGPHARTRADDPLYGDAAIEALQAALRPRGTLAVWSEDPVASFEKRLRRRGFEVEVERPGHGGRRHAVTLARRNGRRRSGRRRSGARG